MARNGSWSRLRRLERIGESDKMSDKLPMYIDVDSTLADTVSFILLLHAKETGEVVGLNDIKDYMELSAIGGFERFMDYYREAWMKYWDKIPLVEQNLPEILNKLREVYDIVFVTDRPYETMDGLYNWLESRGLCSHGEPLLKVIPASVEERLKKAFEMDAILIDDYPYVKYKKSDNGDVDIVYDDVIIDAFGLDDEDKYDLEFEFWFWRKVKIHLRPWNAYDAVKAEIDFTWDRWRELLPGHERFAEIQDEHLLLHARKNSDYSYDYPLANLMACSQMGVPPWIGVAIRLGDKMARLRTLAYKTMAGVPQMVKDETIKDVFDDIAVYAILGRIVYEEGKVLKLNGDRGD